MGSPGAVSAGLVNAAHAVNRDFLYEDLFFNGGFVGCCGLNGRRLSGGLKIHGVSLAKEPPLDKAGDGWLI